jgi:hypothetical protein
MRAFSRSFLGLLELIPGIGRGVRVVNRLHAIRRLEEAKQWGEARALRQATLDEVAFSRSGPLWRSEGEDRLYNRREYAAALEAFQTAEKAMGLSPTLYGVAAPDRVYAGAAQAALLAGQIATAQVYTRKFSALVADLARQGQNPDALQWHRSILEQLQRDLPDTP